MVVLLCTTVAGTAVGAAAYWSQYGDAHQPRQPKPVPAQVSKATSTGTCTPATAPASSAASPATPALVAKSTVPRLAIFEEPGAPRPSRVLDDPTRLGAPLVLLAQRESGQWLEVLLPVRPNGTTGWIRMSDVSLSRDPYRIDVRLSERKIAVSDDRDVVMTAPVGVGACATPTPRGVFFIDALIRPLDPSGPYGDYAYGLSAFSDTLSTFEGGPPVIGIHGTNDPSSVGRDESHGCIRMDNRDIDKLAPILPLGTPVSIEA